ncbi:MAG: glycosyltransferase family 2 protein [Lachnospiraceae bacterium]
MEPLISVIIPVYKVENYLERCVQSVLAQTYENTEILLIDDGSPDRCPKMCDDYAGRYEKIRVFHQENRGLSGARNTGIRHAKGEYLAFVDSDDLLSPYYLESLYHALISTCSDLSQCRWEYVHGNEILESYNAQAEITCYSGREMLSRLYIQTGAYYVVAWNKLYKKELFEEIRYPEGKIHEDEATTYRIFDKVRRAAVVDNALYGYFVGMNSTSITRNSFSKKKLDWCEANEQRVNYFIKKDYRELVIPAVKAWNDGSIDLYFKCRDHLDDAENEMKAIRRNVKNSLKLVKQYGSLPLKTRIGYQMFAAAPNLYGKLLSHVADMSHVEKYS